MKIGWVGLGAMGAPMAIRAALCGFDVLAYDRDLSRADEVSGSGELRVATTLTDVASDREVVALMVATPAQIESVLFGSEGIAGILSPGTIVLVMATVGPKAVVDWASRLLRRDVELVDAPVSGGATRAEGGELLVMASGSTNTLGQVMPLLRSFGSTVVKIGESVGEAQKVKLVNQLICGTHIAVAAEALAFAEALGLDAAECWSIIRHGAAASFMLEDRGARMLARSFEPARSALDIFMKDMGLIQNAAQQVGYSTVITQAVMEIFRAGCEAGFGRLDDSVLIDVMRGTTE